MILVSEQIQRQQENLRLTMNETIPYLPGLSPVAGKELHARFDGGRLSFDGGVLLLREIENGLGLADVLLLPTSVLRPIRPSPISGIRPAARNSGRFDSRLGPKVHPPSIFRERPDDTGCRK